MSSVKGVLIGILVSVDYSIQGASALLSIILDTMITFAHTNDWTKEMDSTVITDLLVNV